MSDAIEATVDIPDPDVAPEAAPDESLFDPGADLPLPDREPRLGEDPAYDPGGSGRQPDVDEEADQYR